MTNTGKNFKIRTEKYEFFQRAPEAFLGGNLISRRGWRAFWRARGIKKREKIKL
jgi:hypothetical protein